MFLLTAVMFDRNGYRRFRFHTNTFLDKVFFLDLEDMDPPAIDDYDEDKEYTEEEPVDEPGIPELTEEESEEYEQQDAQVITAEDIVIEGLDE